MTNQPLVSIGLCTYNRPEGFKKMLDSLVNQTYQNIEIVIGDNSDNDETYNLYKNEYSQDSRIKYFKHEKNIGATKNFEFVLDNSQGKYYMWAADDDWWDTTFIEKAVKKLEEDPEAVACWSKINFVNYDTKEVYPTDYHTAMDNQDLSSPNTVENIVRLLTQNGWMEIYCLIKKEKLINLDINYKNTFGADVLFSIQQLLLGKCLFIDEPLFYYSLKPNYNWDAFIKNNSLNDYSKQHGYFDILIKSIELVFADKKLSCFDKMKFYCSLFDNIAIKNKGYWNISLRMYPRIEFLKFLLKQKDFKNLLLILPFALRFIERNKKT